MIEKLRSFFSQEPLELEDLDSAARKFREEKKQELEQAEQRFQQLREELETVLSELQADLEELEDYEDEKSRAIVEDVVDNIATDRQRLVDDFEMPEGPEELEEELENLVEEFETLSQKEAAVLEEAYLMDRVKEPLDRVRRKKKELEDFLGNGYRTEEKLQRLEQLLDDKQQLELEIQGLEAELEDLPLEQKEQEVQNAEEEIGELEDSPEWQAYQEKKKELEQLKQEKREKERELKTAASKMERGMKKLVYQVENHGLEFDGDLSILKDIRDGNREELLERDTQEIVDAVEEATGVLPMDLLESSVHQKFMEGAEYLMALEDQNSELAMLRQEVPQKKREIQRHPALEKMEKLEREEKEKRRELEELRERKTELEKEIEDGEKQLERVKQRLVEELEEGLDRELKLGPGIQD